MGSHGLVVKADGSWSRGRGFKPRHRILNGCKQLASYYIKRKIENKGNQIVIRYCFAQSYNCRRWSTVLMCFCIFWYVCNLAKIVFFFHFFNFFTSVFLFYQFLIVYIFETFPIAFISVISFFFFLFLFFFLFSKWWVNIFESFITLLKKQGHKFDNLKSRIILTR